MLHMGITGKVWRRLRRRMGLSQKEVAERAGVTQRTVSFLERGHGFSSVMFLQMCDVYEVRPSEFWRMCESEVVKV